MSCPKLNDFTENWTEKGPDLLEIPENYFSKLLQKKVWQGHHCGYLFFSDLVSVFPVVSLQSHLRKLIRNDSPEIKRNVVLL